MRLCVYVSICLCVYVSMCLCVYVSMCLCAYVSMCLCVYVSMCLCVIDPPIWTYVYYVLNDMSYVLALTYKQTQRRRDTWTHVDSATRSVCVCMCLRVSESSTHLFSLL